MCGLFLIKEWSKSGCHSVLKSPRKSDQLRRESISKLPGVMALYVSCQGHIIVMSCHVNIMSMSCQYLVNVMIMSCQYHVNAMSLTRPCYIHVHVHILVLVCSSQPSSKLILCTQKFHCVHRSSFQCYSATHENIVFKGESSMVD